MPRFSAHACSDAVHYAVRRDFVKISQKIRDRETGPCFILAGTTRSATSSGIGPMIVCGYLARRNDTG